MTPEADQNLRDDFDKNRRFRLEDIEAALHRAALRAREIAERTNTPLWIMRDGKIIDLMQDPPPLAPSSTTNGVGET